MASAECCIPAPPCEHTCAGVEETWGALNVYFNSSPGASTKAVLLASDIFGWEAPLLRKLADKVASAGYSVVVPDYFHGEPFNYPRDGTLEDLVTKWLPKHQPAPGGVEESKEIIRILKEKGFQSIGIAGFCWGAKVAVDLAKEGAVQVAVLLHPSFTTTEDVQEVKVPIAILGAEIDQLTPPTVVQEFEKILDSKPEVPHFVKIYPGVTHGWTIRYEINDPKAVADAEEAHSDMLAWFGKYL